MTDVTGAHIATLNYSGLTVTNGGTTVTIGPANVDSPGFSTGGVPGISKTITYGTSISSGAGSFGTSLTVNTGSAVTSVTGVVGLVVTSGAFVTGVTLNLGSGLTSASLTTASDTFTSGILTS